MREHKRNFAKLCLERCDELEEMAVKMAREANHLRSMFTLLLQEDELKGGKSSKKNIFVADLACIASIEDKNNGHQNNGSS